MRENWGEVDKESLDTSSDDTRLKLRKNIDVMQLKIK